MADRIAKVIFGINYVFELDARPGPLFWTSRLGRDGFPRDRALAFRLAKVCIGKYFLVQFSCPAKQPAGSIVAAER